MDHECLRVIAHFAVGVEIIIIERNEFKEDMFVGNEFHALRILAILIGDETFTGKIGFDISDRFAQ